MKTLLTEAQQNEIMEFAIAGHSDALIAFGGDMYRSGLCKGAAIATVSIVTGLAISVIGCVVAECKKKQKQKPKRD